MGQGGQVLGCETGLIARDMPQRSNQVDDRFRPVRKPMLKRQLSAAFFGAILAVATTAECEQAQAQQVLRVGFQDAEPGLVRNSTKQLGGRDFEMWNAI